MSIEKGMIFSTLLEKGCVALADSDEDGRFMGRDTVGVECEFSTDMVVSASPPEYLVAARVVIDGLELGVTEHVAVAFYPALDAVRKLDPKPGEMFAVWEAGESEPSEEAVETLVQGRLPQYVYVYLGDVLWLLDDMYLAATKGACRG